MLAKDTLLDNRYRIVQLLGTGAMGSVYLALDERLSCSVAVKGTIYKRFAFNATQENELRRAFEREAKLLANLQHEAIPRVSDFFNFDDEQYLVMEYIAGEDLFEQSLKMRDRGKTFEVHKVIDWTLQLLDALEYLHSQPEPIIHKDIKLGNIKINPRGRAKLLDFGLAKGFAGEMTRVEAGSLQMGTEEYAPLEQVLKFPSKAAETLRQALSIKHAEKVEQLLNEPTDARSDLYSLGVTVYRLLTGKNPADYLPRALALWDRDTDPTVPIHELNSKVPINVSAVLMSALELDRNHRPPSAAEMRFALERAWREHLEASDTRRQSEIENLLQAESARRAQLEAENAELKRRLQQAGQSAAFPKSSNSFFSKIRNRQFLILIVVGLIVLTGFAFTWRMRERANERALSQELAKTGEIHRKKGEFDEAIKNYDAAIKLDSENIFALTNRADSFCQKQEFERAAADFNEVLRQKPDYDFLYEKRGYCLEKQNKLDEALADYDKALTLDKDETWTYFRRGVVRLFRNELEKAVDDFNEVIQRMPDDWTAYANRAAAYERMGKQNLMKKDLQKAEELKKNTAK